MLYRKYFKGLSNSTHARLFCGLFLSMWLQGCSGDVDLHHTENTAPASNDPGAAGTVARNAMAATSYGTRTINWDHRAHDAYALDEAVSDFGNILFGWQEEKAFNSGGTCRIKLSKNSLGADCGMISKIAVSPGHEYEMQFDVKFHTAFDWSRGGKVGFGFSIGDGFSGCNPAWNGNGGTFRLVWYHDDNGNVYFKPYVYYKDQPEECGDSFGKKYPETGNLVKGHWYTVKIYVKSNTGTQSNGRIKLTVDDTVVLDQAIRWTTNDNKRLINAIYFSTFRGGSQPYWQSETDGYIYFDNLTWKKLAD
jgi:hypothetical protein